MSGINCYFENCRTGLQVGITNDIPGRSRPALVLYKDGLMTPYATFKSAEAAREFAYLFSKFLNADWDTEEMMRNAGDASRHRRCE